MQRVFTEQVGHFKPGNCPEQPHWWWDRYKDVSEPLDVVIKRGLEAMEKRPRLRKTG